MSGGVDSSVAAWLMLKQGYSCQGATMLLYRNPDPISTSSHACCSQKDIVDAARVAFKLGITHEVLDLSADFREQVIDRFIRVYEEGETPNPCIDCNRYLKFQRLLQLAEDRGFDCLVTGHYARIEYAADRERYLLKKAVDSSKDQSYVLYMMTQHQLAHTRFPLGGMTKAQTRAIAEDIGFCNARKHDSQDICFIPDGDYAGFIEHATDIHCQPGDILDREGRPIGRHRGALRYTKGQRKGLGLALGHPIYVCEKDMAANTVTVGSESDLYGTTLEASDMNWISIPLLEQPLRVQAKTHYRHVPARATVYPLAEDRIKLVFDEPQRAITPGQAAVLYNGEIVVGGGTICRV